MRKRLIKNIDWVVTVDEGRRMIADGAIAINGDRIEAVEKSGTLENAFAADETINGRGLIAIPGLIDTNVATVQQLGRGAADLCDIPKFLLERVFAYEAVLSPDDARAATFACQLEMIRSGTTCFADSGSRFPEIVADAAVETGLRAMVPRACYDEYDTIMGSFPAAFARESTEETCRHAVSAIAAVRDVCCDRIQAAVALPWLAAASDTLCNEIAKIAQLENVRVIAAAGRSRDDAVASRRRYSCTEVNRLLNAGLLSPTSIITHAGWTSPDDLAAIMNINANVACCPSTSHRLGTGSLEFGRYPELLALGVNVTLGSGSAMASNYVDVARQLYLFAGGSKSYRLDATIVPPEVALETATIRAAGALGLAKEIGSLEAGKKADITLFNMVSADWAPVINPIANLVFSSRGGAHTVIVDGRDLMTGGRVCYLDEEAILQESQLRAEAVVGRSGLCAFCFPQWPLT
jgi:cytosine/adenosine deaminase-related metal-dependent hydrolase